MQAMGIGMFPAVPRRAPVELPIPDVGQSGVALCAARPFIPSVDQRTLEVFERAAEPEDPFELLRLWLGRVESELGKHGRRPELVEHWRASRVRRRLQPEDVLTSRATVRFVKELFNWYFREDLYGDLQSDQNLILSSGSVDEELWGLPETVKDCLRYALARDWYGYSDSRGRTPTLAAIAAYESARIDGATYDARNVALTLGGTFATSSLSDFILTNSRGSAPVLCGLPNYPPLVEGIARRSPTRLVPLPCAAGVMSVDPLIAAMRPDTPLVLLQTAVNPTGAAVAEDDLQRLILAASPSTIILLDECHEWLGPAHRAGAARARSNVVRISSLSKTWSAPGLKAGWILASRAFISEYYEYASTTFGGPPSLLYTAVEVLARIERWMLEGREEIGPAQLSEFESSYGFDVFGLQRGFESYCSQRREREQALRRLRDASVRGFGGPNIEVLPPHYSINMTLQFEGQNDSYGCFRELLRTTGVSLFPGILTFCFGGAVARVTTARRWAHLSEGMARVKAHSFSQRA